MAGKYSVIRPFLPPSCSNHNAESRPIYPNFSSGHIEVRVAVTAVVRHLEVIYVKVIACTMTASWHGHRMDDKPKLCSAHM